MNKEELRQYSAKLMADKEELQQRIDKAIDYIDAKAHHGDCIIPTTILELKNKDYYKLIDILKGEDKE